MRSLVLVLSKIELYKTVWRKIELIQEKNSDADLAELFMLRSIAERLKVDIEFLGSRFFTDQEIFEMMNEEKTKATDE